MAGTPSDLIRVAESLIGVQESPPLSNQVVIWTDLGLPGMQGQPWCAAYVTYCMIQAGVPFPDLAGSLLKEGYLYCPAAESWAQAHGAVVPNGAEQSGDIVLFQWGDEQADHTGIFLSKNADGTINTIEGNATIPNGNDGVGYHVRYLSNVLMFVRPPFTSGEAGPPPAVIPVAHPTPAPIDWAAIAKLVALWRSLPLSRTAADTIHSGPAVRYLQQRLNVLGYRIIADGTFGPITETTVRGHQVHCGIVADGIVGPVTWGTIP